MISPPVDLVQLARSLEAGGDDEMVRIARLIRSVAGARFRPRDETLTGDREIAEAIRRDFPTAFAGKFESFAAADAETVAAIQRFNTAVARRATRAERSEAEYAVSRKFNSSFLELWGCWKQIVRYVPFVFLAALQRMDDALLEEHVGPELKRALNEYRRAYAVENRERRAEACQRDLLVSLLKLFRKLERDGAMPADVIFEPLLFPERFDAALIFLQQVRNRLMHSDVGERPPQVVETLRLICRWFFFEILAVLAPISRTFAFAYVDRLDVRGDVAQAHVVEYVGLDGPSTASYRVSASPQLDHYEFEANRLYLVARAKEGTDRVLETGDYLDLTPFLIADRYSLGTSAGDRAMEGTAERDVLALDRYGSLRELLYLQLAGKGQAFIERLGSVKDDLFVAIGRFVTRIGGLTAMVTLRGAGSAKLEETRERLWEISKPATSALFATDRFDFNGSIDPNAARGDRRMPYDPDLYVDPRDATVLTSFFEGDRRGLVLAGGSGYGKSNLLVHAYLERCRAGRPAVFLAARMLRTPQFREDLAAHVTSRLYGGWTLDDLAELLEANNETCAIFVDAVNEYTGEGGPLALLQDLLATIQFDDRLPRCRFVVALRTETWAQYTQNNGERPLDTRFFESATGDAIYLGTFDEDARRSALYDRYQRSYALRPGRYQELSPAVRALIARPYLMAVIAETYADRTIPRVLGYVTVFATLTERKTLDSRSLLAPDDERRENFPDELLAFFEAFARLIYGLGATGDAIAADAVYKNEAMQPYVRAPQGELSVLQAALQSGLLVRSTVPRRNALGRVVESSAYAFFHDQYAQFWLAQLFRNEVFADVSGASLTDPSTRVEVARRIVSIVKASSGAPIVTGALAYWLEELQRTLGLANVVPLVGDVAALEDGAARLFVADTLTGWILRDAVAPRTLYEAVFALQDRALNAGLSAAFLSYWPDLDRDATHAFIMAAHGERDADALEVLAESFAALFANESEWREAEQSRVLAFLGTVIPGIEPRAVLAARHVDKYLRFTLQFCAKSVLLLAADTPSMEALREFLLAKLGVVLRLLVRLRSRRGVLLEGLRRPLWGLMESSGFTMWTNAIAQRGANDTFFIESEGVNQSQTLTDFMPYVCAVHNRDFTPFDLSTGSEYRATVLEMLNFRAQSVIGYVAMVTLPFALRGDWERTRDLIDELVASLRPGAVFFGPLLLVNLTYTQPHLRVAALEYLVDVLVPRLLERRIPVGDALLDAVGIAEQDAEVLWPAFERGLCAAFDAFERDADPEAIERLGNDLFRVSFFQRTEIARRTIALVLARGYAEAGSRWRNVALKILAGMRYRNPFQLRALLEGRADADELFHATLGVIDRKTEEGARAFGYETSWNPLVQRTMASNTMLRYVILKYLVGGLAGSRSVGQYTKSWRSFLVETIAAFFGPAQPEVAFATLTREDWESGLEPA